MRRGERLSLYDQRPDLPTNFAHTVERACAPDLRDRFPSIGALVGALSRADQPISGPIPSRLLESSHPPGLDRAPALTPLPAFARPLGALAAVLVIIGFLGFVSSMAFNVTLGRPASFAGESVTDWFIWGLRALLAPALYMAAAAILFALLLGSWRALNMVGPLRRYVSKQRSRLANASGRLHLEDPTFLAQALFAVGLLALAAVIWRYTDLISAFMTPLNEASAREIAALRPDPETHAKYGLVLDMLMLVLSVAWLTVLRAWRIERPRAGVIPLVATLAVIAAAMLLVVAPYRTLWQNEFERIEIEGRRGYIIGERKGELLIYLPEAPRYQRRLVVGEGDARLHRLRVVESIFSP
jgi:hypothetical protein